MDISLALDLGANDFITKPINLADALAKVQRHLAPARIEPPSRKAPSRRRMPRQPMCRSMWPG